MGFVIGGLIGLAGAVVGYVIGGLPGEIAGIAVALPLAALGGVWLGLQSGRRR